MTERYQPYPPPSEKKKQKQDKKGASQEATTEETERISFSTLNTLDILKMAAVQHLGFSTMTPIQSQVIPASIENPTSNILAQAKTGSGKTISFILPILHEILNYDLTTIPTGIYALVIAPTRELALQIDLVARGLLTHINRSDIQSICVTGGASVREEEFLMKTNAYTILIATPGRLLSHIENEAVDLSKLRNVVLDEVCS